MLLIVLATVLILSIAYFQVIQGVFSALIMAILSVLCALAAFNYYESLAQTLRGWGIASTYVYPISLIAIFFLSLLALRILFDRLFYENVVLGTWSDRIGGGAMGIITGMVLVGMLTIALQMMPWDVKFLGYQPYDESLQPAASLAPFKSDRFVLGMVDFLSAGSMTGGEKRFTKVHPNYLLELQANRNRCELPARCDSDVSALRSDPEIYSVPPDDKGNLPPWLTDVSKSATNQENDEQQKDLTYIVRITVNTQAEDSDNWYRLPGTHFRLVTESNGGYHFYYPVAFLTFLHPMPSQKRPAEEKSDWKAIFGESAADPKESAPGRLAVERDGLNNNLTIDWVYKVPVGETPQMIVFRNVSKVRLNPATQINPPNYTPYDETEGKFQKEALKRNQRR
jgi:hypothetical protein